VVIFGTAKDLLRRWVLATGFNRTRVGGWLLAIWRVRNAYRHHHGRSPHLLRPQRFSEKVQWRKLFDFDPRYGVLCDRLAARDFIASRVGEQYLVPKLWSGDDPAEVPFASLSPPYVIKSTHASSHMLTCRAPGDIDPQAAQPVMRGWLAANFGLATGEPGYANVRPQLIAEHMLLHDDGEPLLERFVYVFGGRAEIVQTLVARPNSGTKVVNLGYYDRHWMPKNWVMTRPLPPEPLPRPRLLDEILRLAERIGAGFDHVRVDMYDDGKRLWVGETSLYSFGGLFRFKTDEADQVLGSYWTIERPVSRALKAVLFERRPG
jgi:hypothetical protein